MTRRKTVVNATDMSPGKNVQFERQPSNTPTNGGLSALKSLRFRSNVRLDDLDVDKTLEREVSMEVDSLLDDAHQDMGDVNAHQDVTLRHPSYLMLVTLLLGFLIFFILFHGAGLIFRGERRAQAERAAVHFLAQAFIVSWTGIIKYHGPRPVPKAGRVWVANHTSMIDYAVLSAFTPFAAIMQLHKGWVGIMQKRYLSALGCLWFNRTQTKDRALVSQKMRDHVMSENATPLLIFPEGTCVNNEYCVMFKKGAFDLGATHLFKIMRSWALVADVWFLEPQTKMEHESAADFAARVQKLIADRARLKVAPWDGYLKYYNLAEKHPDMVEKQRKAYADKLKKWV
eukprot:jgi/Picre1/32705/NNA_008050.t1